LIAASVESVREDARARRQAQEGAQQRTIEKIDSIEARGRSPPEIKCGEIFFRALPEMSRLEREREIKDYILLEAAGG